MTVNNTSVKFIQKKCRICNSNKLYTFLSLGKMPLPNGFLTKNQLAKPETYYPLDVNVCKVCWLVQLSYVIPPEIMFKNYLYIPSTSSTMIQHFKTCAEDITHVFNLKINNFVIDIGSNDGTLLGFFKEQEMNVLGIDPATNLVQISRLKGIPTINTFISVKIAIKIVMKYGKAKVITATNVLAHINDLNIFCDAINILLDDDGIFLVEFPYLLDLLDKNEFDTIYHEHLSYFSLTPLIRFLNSHKLKIFDIKKIPVHGGSVRLYLAKNNFKFRIKKTVKEFLQNEFLRKINKINTYDDFARRVHVIKRDLVNYLKKLRSRGMKIVGYGAAAKGNVLLNFCRIDNKLLDYIVDSIPYKQGLFTPGTHIPIYPETRLEKEKPDYTLLLAWNYAEEILNKQIRYREKGGQFIITLPYLRIE